MIHHKRTSCRVCGEDRHQLFLSLGPQPLANSFLRSPNEFADEPFFPLNLYFCQTCFLVHLLDVIDPEVLFRNYIYVTGTSETMAAHNIQYARTLVEVLKVGAGDLVVDIGSNDGSLLKCFKQHGVRTLGVEPAANVAKMANTNGIETINSFFNLYTARQLRESYGSAKVVVGNNVLAHVDEPQDFLRGCKELLRQNGLIIIEVPYLRDLIDGGEYDTIYHEHLSYFSVTTLLRLCDAVGLSIARLDHVPVNGGSLRMYAGKREQYGDHSKDVLMWARDESALGFNEIARYERFAAGVKSHARGILDLLGNLKKGGSMIAGYGAAAKGSTLLNFSRIDVNLISYIVDKNPMKVGLYTPGTHIPIVPVSTLLERQPDYLLILAWNFAEEIMRQQQAYHAGGGRFIIPIPEPKVV